MREGDILTLYTDGVTEQESAGDEQFSMERLKKVVMGNEAEPAAGVVARITEGVCDFAGEKEQEDDLTVVVVKVVGRE